jgi:hypothetical protein
MSLETALGLEAWSVSVVPGLEFGAQGFIMAL